MRGGDGARMRRRMLGAGVVVPAVLVLLAALAAPGAGAGPAQILDEFEDVHGWTAQASPGASLEIARDAGKTGDAMRLDFDFRGEFHMFGDVRIDERHEPLLVEVAVEPAKAVLNAALPVRPKLEIHIAADNGLRRRDERFGVDQAA